MAKPHVHVIPVPFTMTAEQAWAEITTLGRLHTPPVSDADCNWATVECDGVECVGIAKAPDYQRYYNDELVEGGD